MRINTGKNLPKIPRKAACSPHAVVVRSARKSSAFHREVQRSPSVVGLKDLCADYAKGLDGAAPLEFLREVEGVFFVNFGKIVNSLGYDSHAVEKENLFMGQIIFPALRRFTRLLLNREKGCLEAMALLEKYEWRLLRSDAVMDGRAAGHYQEATAFLCRSLLPPVLSLFDGALGVGEGNLKTTFFYRILQHNVKEAFAFSRGANDGENSQVFHFKCAMIPYVAAYFFFASTVMQWCSEDAVVRKNPLHDLFPLRLEDAIWLDFRLFAQKHPSAFWGQMLFFEEEFLSRNIDAQGRQHPQARAFFKKALGYILNPSLVTPPFLEELG